MTTSVDGVPFRSSCGRNRLCVRGKKRRAGDDDARGGHQRGGARAHRRRRALVVLDHVGDDVVLTLTGRDALVDRLVDLVAIGMRLIMASRIQDPPEKVGWRDDHWAKIPGGGAYAEEADGIFYLAASLRNVGTGIAVIQGWYPYGEWLGASQSHPEPARFRRQTRDLYIPPGDVGFWQGAIRDQDDAEYFPLLTAIKGRQRLTGDLLYSDHEGGQLAISRVAMLPRQESGWTCVIARG